MRKFLIFTIIAILCQSLQAQILPSETFHSNGFQIGSKDYTTMPIRLPLLMAGSFAEIRPNHFHSGLDIKTDGKEGEPVYAPQDGYVSRINISAWGGGKVLYITHPDGYRTVYMHLSEFCGEIGKFVRNYQYANHVYAFDIELPKDSIRVRKGQLVALTGNTGGSSGPHLHYEIRLAENDQTINPLLFGLPYNDNIAPTIAGIKIYPADDRTAIGGKRETFTILPKQLPMYDTITVSGRFYTGIYTYDQHEPNSRNKNGIHRIELYLDDTLFYAYSVPTFLFEETRAINAIIDYPHYQRTREYYIITRHLRGDRNNFSIAYRDNGFLKFNDNKVHRLRYRVSDHKGNYSQQTLYLRAKENQGLEPTNINSSKKILASGEPITYFKRFRLDREGFSADIPPYTVYDNDHLAYSRQNDPASLSDRHRIILIDNPLPPHQSFEVTLDKPHGIDESLVSKLTIVCINGNNVSALPTTIKNGRLSAPTRSFGDFAIRIDTVAPTVKPTNFGNGKPFRTSRITVKIADNLSGIVSYSCFINGEWQLAEHDGKTATLNVDARYLHKGQNRVTFRLADAAGNTTEKTWKIVK